MESSITPPDAIAGGAPRAIGSGGATSAGGKGGTSASGGSIGSGGAIGSGGVDALVVSRPEGERIFSLQGADHPYRVLVETMNEGAATLAPDGTIVYGNGCLARMLKVPLEKLIGTPLADIRAAVLAQLRGPAGCTHLNDALRALGEVPALVKQLPA